MTCLAPSGAIASRLKPETLQAWNSFISEVDERAQRQSAQSGSFLWSDQVSGQVARLRRGDIMVSPTTSHVPHKVPGGLIHDWIGAAFIPGVTLDDVLRVIRSYGRYKEFYQPTIVDSRLIHREEASEGFSMLLASTSLVAKTAIDADFQASGTRLDDQRWYGITRSTRVQEVADYGTASQHTLPENEGKGLIWRLHSIVRLQERDGGVYIEVEAVALSRDIPVTLRWLVVPMVRRTSASALTTTLRQTEAAVRLLRKSL